MNDETPWLSFARAQGAAGRRLEELAGASSRKTLDVRPERMRFCCAGQEGESEMRPSTL